MVMKSRLIIADDHPMVCKGVCDIVAGLADAEVVATAYDGEEAEHLARTIPADLLILDIALPRKSGLKVLEALRAEDRALPVLFFSMYPASQYVPYLRQQGAQGFLGKEANESTLVAAIRKILAGKTVFPESAASGHGRRSMRGGRLSAREDEVMRHLLRGVPLVVIAAEMGNSAQSVTTYRRRLLDKLNVTNNAELIALMQRLG